MDFAQLYHLFRGIEIDMCLYITRLIFDSLQLKIKTSPLKKTKTFKF